MNGFYPPYGVPYIPWSYTPPTPEQIEFERIRQTSQKLGYVLVLMQGIILLLALPFMLFGNYFGDWMSDTVGLFTFNMAATVPAFVIPFALGPKMLGKSAREVLRFGKADFRPAALSIGAVLGAAAVGNALTSIFVNAVSSAGLPTGMAEYEVPRDPLGLLCTVLLIAAIPALAEEFAFRGIFMELLRPFGDRFAVIVSAAFFGLMHGNLVQAPFAFVVGLALGYTVMVTGSLWPAVAAHFVNNLLSVLADVGISSLPPAARSAFSGLYMTLMAAVGALCLSRLIRTGQLTFRETAGGGRLSAGEKLRAFSKAPAMIIAVVWMILNMAGALATEAFRP